MLGVLTFLPGQLAEEVARVFPSRIVVAEIDAQREVGVGGLQMHADRAAHCGLHLGGIILRSLGRSWLIDNRELSSKNSVGWSWKLKVAERLVPKVAIGKEVGGWSEAGSRGVPGSVPSKHC